MKTLANELKEQIPSVSLEDCKKIIYIHDKFLYEVRHYHCAVCMNPLTNEELKMRSSMNFNFCCTEHQKYVDTFQLNIIRKELNIPEPNIFSLSKID